MGCGSDLSFKDLNGSLLFRVTGDCTSYEQSMAVLRQIVEKLRNASCTSTLIDTTGTTGGVPNVDRFRLTLSFARMLPPYVSVAVVVTRERHIPDYLLEILLRKHGIEGAEFVDHDAAVAWLNRQREPLEKAS